MAMHFWNAKGILIYYLMKATEMNGPNDAYLLVQVHHAILEKKNKKNLQANASRQTVYASRLALTQV